MKVNRSPVPSFSASALRRDHDFWAQYSRRLSGDFIRYETPIKEIATWLERVYLQRDLRGYSGNRKFLRDADAQKAFSKLRTSIASVYAWRLSPQCPAEYRPKTEAETQALLREAEFAFKQAYAFCPYSPEALFRFCNLLVQFNRSDDALVLLDNSLKFDPRNTAIQGHRDHVLKMKKAQETADPEIARSVRLIEEEVRTNPANIQAAFDLATFYLRLEQTNRAVGVLDKILTQPNLSGNDVLAVAKVFAKVPDLARLELSLERLVQIVPRNPESWYDLAAFKSGAGKSAEALRALRTAIELSTERRRRDPGARDLASQMRQDPRFDPLRASPEYQSLPGVVSKPGAP